MDQPQNNSKVAQGTAPPTSPVPTASATYPSLKDITPPAPGPVPGAEPGGNTNTIHPVDNFVPVTDAMLRNPAPSDWLLFRGNYQGWGYSKLDEINKANVKTLQLVWARVMEPGINEGTPLIYNGVMYLPNPGDVIQAIDATTGELLWQYRRRLPSADSIHTNYMLGLRKRSIFLYNDKIYFLSGDNYLVALDAKTGKEVWQVNRGGDNYVTNTSGPLVIDGVVVAGSQCQDAAFTCWADGHDAETGKQLWHNELIPRPGQPGDETWANKPYNERWATDVWGTLTYDPDTDLLYYGSSGITPASEAQRHMAGAAMAGTDTRWAVNPKTGQVIWRRQLMPQDDWDQDCTFEMMPITTPVHPDASTTGMFAVGPNADSSSRKTLTGAPCKNAIMWSLDAKTGDFLWAKATAVQNLVDHIDSSGQVFVNQSKLMNDFNKTYHICPTFNGGRNWNFSAYSPETNAMYVRINNVCSDMHVRAENIPSKPSDEYNTAGEVMVADGKTNFGRIDAVSVETGKTLWTWETPISNYSPLLATAGGLLFNGNMDRYVRAIDQTNGKVLWQVRLGSQVVGTPVTYSVNGRQYVAIAAGGPAGGLGGKSINKGTESIDQVSGGNTVYVFALPQ
jgi:alcohol dehydrogenase (cytochrome c)